MTAPAAPALRYAAASPMVRAQLASAWKSAPAEVKTRRIACTEATIRRLCQTREAADTSRALARWGRSQSRSPPSSRQSTCRTSTQRSECDRRRRFKRDRSVRICASSASGGPSRVNTKRLFARSVRYSDQAYWHYSKNVLDAGALDAELRAILRREAAFPEHEFERIMSSANGSPGRS